MKKIEAINEQRVMLEILANTKKTATNDMFAKKRKIDEIKEREKRMSWYDMCAITDKEDEEETEKADKRNVTKMAKMSLDDLKLSI